MDGECRGGWVYIMANQYQGRMYVGLTAHLIQRIHQHRTGMESGYCAEKRLDRLVWAEQGENITALIAHEKRPKRWRREWKFALIERANPDGRDLAELL